ATASALAWCMLIMQRSGESSRKVGAGMQLSSMHDNKTLRTFLRISAADCLLEVYVRISALRYGELLPSTMFHNPVCIPCIASIKRKGLLPASGILSNIIPGKANVHWLPIRWCFYHLIKEPNTILEFAH